MGAYNLPHQVNILNSEACITLSSLSIYQIRLGNSTETPIVGDIVHNQLCPVVRKVISDGLRPYMTGFHVFGKIHVSVWKVAEESAELGKYRTT